MPSPLDPVLADGDLRRRAQPTLTTGDLQVRPWRPDDASAVLAAYQDPAITYWHVRSMNHLDEAEAWIAAWPRRWADETGADWAVARGETVVGRVGIKRIDPWDGIGELAYWTLAEARRRGTASRAVTAVSEWCLGVLGLHRLELMHSVRNAASCAVARSAGFAVEGTLRREGRHTDGWHDTHLHARIGDH